MEDDDAPTASGLCELDLLRFDAARARSFRPPRQKARGGGNIGWSCRLRFSGILLLVEGWPVGVPGRLASSIDKEAEEYHDWRP
jgi:hypothetical protein